MKENDFNFDKRGSRKYFPKIGQKFGKLTLIEIIPPDGNGKSTQYKCLCSCGIEKYCEISRLFSGRVKSCGKCKEKKLPKKYERNTFNIRNYYMKLKYSITEIEYRALHEAQEGKCGICKKEETAIGASGEVKNMAVDHCHKTNKVRGLLCQRCNTALGSLKDDIDTVKSMLQYLSENQ